MSRDFTPRQSLAAEEYTGISMWHIMETMTFSYNGKEELLYNPDDIAIRKKYPLLGKLVNKFSVLYTKLADIEGGLDVLRDKDNELAVYIEQEKGDPESYLIKWFEGKLDPNFYYSEWNEELFCEELIKEARGIPQFVACLDCDNIIDLLNSEPINGMLECPFCGFRYNLDPQKATLEDVNKCFLE